MKNEQAKHRLTLLVTADTIRAKCVCGWDVQTLATDGLSESEEGVAAGWDTIKAEWAYHAADHHAEWLRAVAEVTA